MTRLPLDRIRHETHFAIHIATRDLAKRLSAFCMMLAVCWHGGYRDAVLLLAGFAVAAEVAARIIGLLRPEREEDIPLWMIAAMWTIDVSSAVAYLWPAVLLAGQPSIALMLAGFLWLFGVLVHISNTFLDLPFYNWSQMIPGFAVAIAVFLTAEVQEFGPSPPLDWFIGAAMVIVYAANTVETLTRQKDTQRALDAARAEANTRLRALEALTRHDSLTGLLNRQAFDEAVEGMLARRRPGQHVGVLLIDLDGFKPINDTYSHAAGDAVLVAVARRLESLAGESGVAARLGGDEFALALPALTSDRAALRLAGYAIREISRPIPFGEKSLRIAASVGIGLSGIAGDSVAGLCSAADRAMFRAKGDPGQRAVLFEPDRFPARPSLEDRRILSEALALGQILPYYQPKVRLDTGAVIGFEALARWEHPTRGTVPPSGFLPQINELGLQGDFLTAITRAVLSDITRWLDEGLDPGQVSVNVPEVALATQSGRADLDRLLTAFPRAVRHITFEITEDVFFARAGGMIQDSIARLRLAGIRISLDDFGTGFASFQHLRQLEFDEMKIDTSFVADLGRDPAVEVLVGGFLSIASGLSVAVIAEGVETEEQRAMLLRMGCRFGQGYRFGRAAPFEETRLRLHAEQMRGAGPDLQRQSV
jgi:diguanylate cyclase (GGDEF)-like protein